MLPRVQTLPAFVFALFWAGFSALQAAPLPMPPSRTVVMVAKDAPPAEQDAAKLLQTWLRKACGVATGFEIVSGEQGASTPPANTTAIALGSVGGPPDPRLSSMEDDGFLIHQVGRTIAITGHTGDGTYYGAVEFLNRYAGVRFYMPTEFWTSLPANHTVTFDGGDVLSQPFVNSGDISRYTPKDYGDPDWLRRIGGQRRKGGTHQHNIFSIFPPAKFAQTHPEIYPIYDGQRYIPATDTAQAWQIDFAEPTTLVAAEESLTDYFHTNPSAQYIAVSINDNDRWSESARNQKIIADFRARDPQGDYLGAAASDIYWRFMNQLAAWLGQKFPGKLLVGLAYRLTSTVPSFPLEKNIVVYANYHLSELPYYIASPNGQPSLLDHWLAAAPHFGNHEWYEGEGFILPRIYSGYWSQFLQLLTRHFSSVFMHAEAYPNWGFDGPKYYIMSKMWWDPQADPQALTKQFCDDLFGPAAPAMFNYFTQAEALWTQLDDTDGPKRKIDVWYNQFTTTPASRLMIQHCQDFLEQAAAAAQTADQQARVALFAKCFAFSESLFKLAEEPDNTTLHDQAVAQARDLAQDPWTVYNPDFLLSAIQAIYHDPAKK